jgi:hypothetical protein
MLQNELFYESSYEDSNGELVFDEKISEIKKNRKKIKREIDHLFLKR